MKSDCGFRRAILVAGAILLVGCGSSSGPRSTNDTTPKDAGAKTDGATADGAAGDPGLLVESSLTLELQLTTAVGDGGVSSTGGAGGPSADGGGAGGQGTGSGGASGQGSDAGVDKPDSGDVTDGGEIDAPDAGAIDPGDSSDGGDIGDASDAPAPLPAPLLVTTLEITARDGTTPIVTDLWLYTLEGGAMVPLTQFTSTAARKTPRLMLPATIAGQPSGLTPADDGRLNGLMSNSKRGKLVQGAFVSTVDGTVTVTLSPPPMSPILVVAGVEDQRYAGAAAINPDGTKAAVPAGVGVPETHARRSFERDVKPILGTVCIACHNPTGLFNANLYLVTGSREDLVNDNFALKEQALTCQKATPTDPAAQAACVQAITATEYLVEPGAPALSGILQRARPDEEAGTSTLGLVWYGSRGSRYNTTYGDRRMPSTTESTMMADWTNTSAYFDTHAAQYQILFDWVAQGAPP